MCLTESHAGSDVGAANSQARKQPDGTYKVRGTKIFISGGDHDLAENIIHLVLARVECYTRRSAASRHPSWWRGAATSM